MKTALIIVVGLALCGAIGFFGRLLGLNGTFIGIPVAFVSLMMIGMAFGEKEDE